VHAVGWLILLSTLLFHFLLFVNEVGTLPSLLN